jgi:hypothetical protein
VVVFRSGSGTPVDSGSSSELLRHRGRHRVMRHKTIFKERVGGGTHRGNCGGSIVRRRRGKVEICVAQDVLAREVDTGGGMWLEHIRFCVSARARV